MNIKKIIISLSWSFLFLGSQMAARMNLNENIPYARIVLLLMKCGTTTLRRLLDETVSQYNQNVEEFLNSRKTSILSTIVGRQNASMLFPLKPGVVDINSWDISLVLNILQTQCKCLSDKLKADLEDLRIVRNKIMHLNGTTLKSRDYVFFRRAISVAIEEALLIINDDSLSDDIFSDIVAIDEGQFISDMPHYLDVLNTTKEIEKQLDQGIQGKRVCVL